MVFCSLLGILIPADARRDMPRFFAGAVSGSSGRANCCHAGIAAFGALCINTYVQAARHGVFPCRLLTAAGSVARVRAGQMEA